MRRASLSTLRSNIREQLHEKMIILLRSSPLPIIRRRVLKLDPFKRSFCSGLIRILSEAGIVDPAQVGGGIETSRGGRPWGECYTGRLFLGAFVAFGGVLDEFDGFAIAAVDYGCN